MSIIRCPHGHFFEDEKYDSCPTCKKQSAIGWRWKDEKTVSFGSMEMGIKEIHLSAEEAEKQKVWGNWDSEKTIALTGSDASELLVGWLVCISGERRGRDYRLYSGFNRIGRSLDSDICIQDRMITENMHCAVVYDEKGGAFYVVPGKGSITYLNQKTVQEAVGLQEGDRIELGETILEFVPFCKGEHTWKTIQTL